MYTGGQDLSFNEDIQNEFANYFYCNLNNNNNIKNTNNTESKLKESLQLEYLLSLIANYDRFRALIYEIIRISYPGLLDTAYIVGKDAFYKNMLLAKGSILYHNIRFTQQYSNREHWNRCFYRIKRKNVVFIVTKRNDISYLKKETISYLYRKRYRIL